MCGCLVRPASEQHLRCSALRAWVTRWVADDANYTRMAEYDARHQRGQLDIVVSAWTRPLLVTSVEGSLA